jgi:hypothetical protein
MAKKEPATVTWSEVCKKVQMGDGLYSTCRQKVGDFPAGGNPQGGFQGGVFDEVPSALPAPPGRRSAPANPDPDPDPDFESRIAKSALKIPAPPTQEELAKHPPGYSHPPELWGFPLNQLLMYGGVAFLAWFFLMRGKAASIIGTETPAEPASSDVTPTKAA